MHDTSQDGQTTDEAWHPQHGRRGHHEPGAASPRFAFKTFHTIFKPNEPWIGVTLLMNV